MMSNTAKTATVQIGPGFLGLLTIAFVVLKLTGVIAWPWLWVLAPLWLPAGIGVVILLAVASAWLILDRR